MFKYNNINYSNYSNNIDYKYNYKIYYSLLLHLLFLFSFSLIFSLFYSYNILASSGSGGGESCGSSCDPCDKETVDKCNGFWAYTGVSYLDGSFDFETYSRCIHCTPKNFTYPTMEEIRKRDFTETPNFFKIDFEMFPKDGSYHIVPDNVVESLKSHISCKDDTSRYILKEAYTEKKNTENVVIPYCKKWIVGISDNYVQSALDDGSVNKLNPNTDIKVFCKEIDESKHININNPDTIDNYINLNSSIKLYDGFVCRDGFHKYEGGVLKGSCKVPLRYEVIFDQSCVILIKKIFRDKVHLSKFGEVMCSSFRHCHALDHHSDRYECYEQGTQEYNELCKKLSLWNGCRDSRKACIYVYDKVEKCKIEEKERCKKKKQTEMNRRYNSCNSNFCSITDYEKEVSEKCNETNERYSRECNYSKQKLEICKKNIEDCKSEGLECAEEEYNKCISLISSSSDGQAVCEDNAKSEYETLQGCYVDNSEYTDEKIDDVVKYEVDICQKPIFLDSVKKVNIEKIYDPNLVNQN